MLDWAMAHLIMDGVTEVIVNLHHFPDPIEHHVARVEDYGIHVAFSREPALLGTGGGVKKAAWFLKNGPFVLRNVDVLASFSTQPLVEKLLQKDALAVLAVQERETSRALLWDADRRLCGRLAPEGPRSVGRTDGSVEALGFGGIHAVSPRIFQLMPDRQHFCIVEFYLDMAARGHTILCHRVDEFYWRDLGTPASLKAVERDLADAGGGLLPSLGMEGIGQGTPPAQAPPAQA